MEHRTFGPMRVPVFCAARIVAAPHPFARTLKTVSLEADCFCPWQCSHGYCLCKSQETSDSDKSIFDCRNDEAPKALLGLGQMLIHKLIGARLFVGLETPTLRNRMELLNQSTPSNGSGSVSFLNSIPALSMARFRHGKEEGREA